jgi:predicted kinase
VTGTPQTLLVVLRGPSGSGKSTAATALRRALGRGTALVEQDHVRRILLREHDTAGALNIDLIDTIARQVLDAGRHVVLEGIMPERRYGAMLRALMADHAGTTVCAYLDVPFEETVRRHAGRPKVAEFGREEMAAWWNPDDRRGVPGERVLDGGTTADGTVRVLLDALGRSEPGRPDPG